MPRAKPFDLDASASLAAAVRHVALRLLTSPSGRASEDAIVDGVSKALALPPSKSLRAKTVAELRASPLFVRASKRRWKRCMPLDQPPPPSSPDPTIGEMSAIPPSPLFSANNSQPQSHVLSEADLVALRATSPSSPFSTLPLDAIATVISFNSAASLVNLSRTCRAFRNLWRDDALWRALYQRQWPDDAVATARSFYFIFKFKHLSDGIVLL
jgi:hypothetical protein